MSAPFKWRVCLVCGKGIYGQKPVGSIEIFNKKERKVGTEIYYAGKSGYAHLECKKKVLKRIDDKIRRLTR